MKPSDVIKKAILSEKAVKLMEKGIYTFLVTRQATKDEIAKAITDQFAVSVAKVNVASFAPKTKRIASSRKQTKIGGGTKAIVWLAPGQTIASLSPKAKKASKKEKEVEKVSVEGKEH